MKFFSFIIFLYILISLTNTIANNSMNPYKKQFLPFKKCKVTKSYIDNYEPEIFQPSNNLLRKSGEKTIINTKVILIKGRLLDEYCVPISDAKVYLWHLDNNKKYPYLPLRKNIKYSMFYKNKRNISTFTGSGITTTNNKGDFYFITIHPGKIHNFAHINIRAEHQLVGKLQTKIFLKKEYLNQKQCGEISEILKKFQNYYDYYSFDIIMPGRTLRRY